MTRAEAFRIGKVIADRMYEIEKPSILAKQHIERMKQKSDSAAKHRVTDKMYSRRVYHGSI